MKRAASKPMVSTVSEVLRQTIRQTGQSLYRVAKDAAVPYATLHRFMSGERTINSETIDKLCASLGLRLMRG